MSLRDSSRWSKERRERESIRHKTIMTEENVKIVTITDSKDGTDQETMQSSNTAFNSDLEKTVSSNLDPVPPCATQHKSPSEGDILVNRPPSSLIGDHTDLVVKNAMTHISQSSSSSSSLSTTSSSPRLGTGTKRWGWLMSAMAVS